MLSPIGVHDHKKMDEIHSCAAEDPFSNTFIFNSAFEKAVRNFVGSCMSTVSCIRLSATSTSRHAERSRPGAFDPTAVGLLTEETGKPQAAEQRLRPEEWLALRSFFRRTFSKSLTNALVRHDTTLFLEPCHNIDRSFVSSGKIC
jgi:hypothetical protein